MNETTPLNFARHIAMSNELPPIPASLNEAGSMSEIGWIFLRKIREQLELKLAFAGTSCNP